MKDRTIVNVVWTLAGILKPLIVVADIPGGVAVGYSDNRDLFGTSRSITALGFEI